MSPASRRNRIPNMRGISDRPSEVADRLVAGQREGDLIVGRYGRSHLVTLVERHSRFLLVLPVPDATTVTVVDAVTRAFLELPDSVRGSLTWDRGVEMTNRSPLWAEELRREESRRAGKIAFEHRGPRFSRSAPPAAARHWSLSPAAHPRRPRPAQPSYAASRDAPPAAHRPAPTPRSTCGDHDADPSPSGSPAPQLIRVLPRCRH